MNTRPTKRFSGRYYHDGAWWSVDFHAYDFPDAEVRCRKLGIQLDGLHIMTIPGWVPEWLMAAIVRMRNFLFGRREE